MTKKQCVKKARKLNHEALRWMERNALHCALSARLERDKYMARARAA